MYGLILAGGRSTRMGQDKSNLFYHQNPQRIYLYQLLENFCEKVFISARKEQISVWNDQLNYIEDSVSSEGPLSGIVSAYEKYPEESWLVVACDMPFVDQNTISFLLKYQDPQAYVNVFQNPQTLDYEPLLGLWHSKTGLLLKDFYANGQRSPRRFLRQINCHAIAPQNTHWLLNANDPEEYAQILEIMRK